MATADNASSYTPFFTWSGLSIEINGGDASTDDNDVTLTLNCVANGSAPDEMQFSEDGATWGDWVAYATTRAYQLSPQTSYPTEAKSVYVRFRRTLSGTVYTSSAVSDSIDLEVSWTGSVVIANRDAEQTYDREVSVRFRGTSTAHGGLGHGDDVVARYRIRDAAGSWSAWLTASPDGAGWASRMLTFDGDGARTVQVQWEDDDGNAWTASDAIEVLPAGEQIGGAPPVIDITNWRLLIGGKDFIDDLEGPPPFSLGQHGPGALSGVMPVEDPMQRPANELVGGADVELWDGVLRLWYGKLKPLAPTSDDESALTIEARGPLDLAKQHEGFVTTLVDGDPAHWFVVQSASKAFTLTNEGRVKVMHEKGRGVEDGRGAGYYYWVNGGRRNQAIDHLEFGAGSSVDVGATNWFCRVSVSTSPWGSWTVVKEWNNETVSGAVRIPASGSFADAGQANVYAVRVILISSEDLTAAESANNRWVDLVDPDVYVAVAAKPRADEVLAALAAELGYTAVTSSIGDALDAAAWVEETTVAATMEDVAQLPSAEVEWGWWWDGEYVARPKPTTPPNAARHYSLDTRRCDWGVTTDEEQRKDYVKVVYQITGDATYPRGTVRTLYRPTDPPDFLARVGLLDLTEEGPITAGAAADGGDQWLAWNDAQCQSGPIGGFGAYLKAMDGQWVPACHARPGDFVRARDVLDAPSLYITGVEVNTPDDVVLSVGGAEVDFDFVPPHGKGYVPFTRKSERLRKPKKRRKKKRRR